MRTSDNGIALIREFEGCRLEAYPDPATGGEPFTIGVGHTGSDVYPGLMITEEQADELLRRDLARFERCVDGLVDHITQNQFDACVSLAFNIGCANFRTSTLCRKLREGDDIGAAQEFLRWNKANGRVMAGLTRRRQAEMNLFLA